MTIVKKVLGRQILDSRGNPTVEVELWTNSGKVRASIPSGASTGKHEAVELRDEQHAYHGKGVLDAVSHVNKIGKDFIGKKLDLKAIDHHLIHSDGTANKSRLGANATLGISLAALKATACANNESLYKTISHIAKTKIAMPKPMFNIINGGVHAGNNLDVQEYMVVPQTKSFSENLRIGSEIYHELRKNLIKKYGKASVNVGDEGGFAPQMTRVEEPINAILDAAIELGYENKIKIGLDVAASRLKVNNKYVLEGRSHTGFDMIDIYKGLANSYPIISIEDPFAEDDWQNFYALTKELGSFVKIVGDDLLVTNSERIQQAIDLKSCNALLLKMNQIGTISETIHAAQLAQKHNWNVIVSHRSGETEDTSIADLSVGLGAQFIKAGAPARGERTAKYNQLLRIEEQLRK